jgi:hypothetical protein
MGDAVPCKEGNSISVKLEKAVPGSILNVYTERGAKMQETINDAAYKKEIPMEDRLFYRVEVWKTQN